MIIPSLPTFFVASPMILPIALSPLVEIVPTWAISSEDWTLLARQQAAFGAGASREPWARSARRISCAAWRSNSERREGLQSTDRAERRSEWGGGKLKWLSRKRPLGLSRDRPRLCFLSAPTSFPPPHSVRLFARQFNDAK